MKRARLVLIGLFAACLPMLMAPTGGIPQNLNIQSVSTRGNGNAYLSAVDVSNTATHNLICLGNTSCSLGAIHGDGSTIGAFAPPPILCNTACSLSAMRIGQSAQIAKNANTSRASTVALTADPDLQFTGANTGWEFSYTLYIEATGGGGGGLSVNLFGDAGSSMEGSGASYCNSVAGAMVQWSNLHAIGTGGGGQACALSSLYPQMITGLINLASGAAFGVQWSQNTSNATVTVVTNNSYFLLTRLK